MSEAALLTALRVILPVIICSHRVSAAKATRVSWHRAQGTVELALPGTPLPGRTGQKVCASRLPRKEDSERKQGHAGKVIWPRGLGGDSRAGAGRRPLEGE